jgi:CRISPR-associated protein Csm1
MKEKIINAAIAGLLHDVGKVEQRARDDPWNPAPGIEREGQPVHATWSTYFIQNHVPKEYRGAALAGAYHHAPERSPAEDKSLSVLIALADKLSAGERADPEDQAKRPPKQMVTIFDRIHLEEKGQQNGKHFLPLQALRLSEQAIFPGDEVSEASEVQAYEDLCEDLRKTAEQPIEDGQTYLENLLGGLQATTWCVPSAYYHSEPDVSLYDHSRMTAALAVCLAERDSGEVKTLLSAVQNDFLKKATADDKNWLDQPVALLVGGDISGVQDFIYTISSKGAAKTLRGRSFYLQLLTEAVLRYVLRELGLPYSNVIYSGGGHFYLLAPVSAEGKFPAIKREITRKLLEHHSTSLYLAVGSTQVPASGFRVGKFPFYWGEMHRALALAKQQRYTELGEQLYERIFQPPEWGGNPQDTCSVCGEDYRKVRDWDEEHEEQAKICTLCESFAYDLGKPLPSAEFVALGFSEPVDTYHQTALDALAAFGVQVQFLESVRDAVTLPDVERVTLWALGDPKEDRWPDCDQVPAARTLRYTVNRIPPMTFDELQIKVAAGFKRLGVLRMDVDNLGDVFKNGLDRPNTEQSLATLARLSTLSFQMSLFFEGWVKHICETGEYQGKIYAVYAGGDDIFLIGPWDIIPDLACTIVKDFSVYTGRNPALHLSGGMTFIRGKYPVYQAASDAFDALEQAKSLPGKNAFSYLGQAWPWSTFDSVTDKHNRLLNIISKKDTDEEALEGPQAIIQILRQLAADEADERKRVKDRAVWGPWMWQGAYSLKRMVERCEKKKQSDLAQAIESIRDDLDKNAYSDINQWGTAARWTQLETRKGSEN